MNVEITGRHVIITQAIRSYVLKRLGKFDKFFGNDARFHVIIGVEKERHTVEILLKSKILSLAGRGETEDMYASIVSAIGKLERQAIKSKSRIIETKRQKAKAKSVEEKTGIVRSRSGPRVRPAAMIMEEGIPQTAMAVDEAVVELGQSEYPFVIFRNIESGSMNILYRRRDGRLGLMQE